MNTGLLTRLRAIRSLALPRAPVWLLAWAEAERGRFMPWLTVAMGVGVLSYFGLHREPPWAVGPALVAAAALLCLVLRQKQGARAAALAGLFAAVGFASAQWASGRAPPLLSLPRTAAIFSGRVVAVEQLPTTRRVTLAGAQLDGGGPNLAAHAASPAARRPTRRSLPPVTSVRARSVLRPPAPPAYPGAWDLQRDAYFSAAWAAAAWRSAPS